MGARLGALAVVAALTVVSCSSASNSSSSPATGSDPVTTVSRPESGTIVAAPAGFRAVTVTVRLADGTTAQRCLLLADTAPLREQGLMGVTDPDLGGYDGMLFVFGGTFTGGFWMKDTLIPLSIAFAGPAGDVVSTADMVPCPADTKRCPVTTAAAPYAYAVEVPSGRLTDVGLTAGASLDPALGPACDPAPGPARTDAGR